MIFKNNLPITIFIAIILIGVSAYHFYNKKQREEIEKKWGVSLIDGATIEKTVHNVTWDNYGRLIYEVDLKHTNYEQRKQMLVKLNLKNNKDSIMVIKVGKYDFGIYVRDSELGIKQKLKGVPYRVVSHKPMKIIFYFKEENKLLLFLRTPF